MKILWADDHPDEARTFAAALDSSEHDITFVSDAAQALELVRDSAFDLLLIDLAMPPGAWGGLWLLERLQELSRRPPALVVSGQGSHQETIRAMRLGAADYVEKANIQAELAERVLAAANDALQQLLAAEESDTVEFKQTLRADPSTGAVDKALEASVVKTIAAFANSGGGYLVVGRADWGEVTGLEPDLSTLRKPTTDYWEVHLRNLISVHLGAPTNQFVGVRFSSIERQMVAVVAVDPVKEPVFSTAKGEGVKFFIRAGNGTRDLDIAEAYRYFRSRFPWSGN